jgi:hypothetical protein
MQPNTTQGRLLFKIVLSLKKLRLMRIGIIRFAMIFMLVSVFSCSASKQNGFSYRPAHAGPDMSGTTTETIVPVESPVDGTAAFAEDRSEQLNSEKERFLAADMARIVEQQVIANGSAEKVEVRKAVHDIAAAYTSEKNITLTQKQLRKLDKYTAKLERKQQKQADVNWGPQNNLEIFLLAAAGVGLVVGFFSSIGWFVFLVAALVYLYLKLLKN